MPDTFFTELEQEAKTTIYMNTLINLKPFIQSILNSSKAMSRLYFILLLFLFSSSCSKDSFWEEWNKKSLLKSNQKPIALLLYSSLDPSSSKLLGDKKLAKILKRFSLFSIDIEKSPYSTRRYGDKIPCISFLDKNGNSYFIVENASLDKIKPLVDKFLELGNSNPRSLGVIKPIDNMSSNLLFPGEEREISETVIKNIKKNSKKNIPLDLLSYAYRESADPALKEIMVQELINLISSSRIDVIAGGVWENNGYTKRLDEFAKIVLQIHFLSSYCKNCENIITDIINTGFNEYEQILKREDGMYNAGIIFDEPFNFVLTEKKMIKLIDNEGLKKIENVYNISYPKMKAGKRFLAITNRVDKNTKNKSNIKDFLNKIKQSVYTDDSYIVNDALYSYPNILFARLYVNLALHHNYSERIDKSISLKNNIYLKFKDNLGLIKSSEFGHPYLRDQTEFIKLYIDLFNKTLNAQYLDEAINFSKILLKSFCEEWQKVAFCSDLPFEIMKNETGYFSVADYDIDLNSELAIVFLQLHSLTNEETFFKLSYKILSAFKNKAKIMMHNKKINDGIHTYTKALIALYTNPLKVYVYLVQNKKNQKTYEANLQRIKKDIFNVSYPISSLQIMNEQQAYLQNLKNNTLLVCLGETCKRSTVLQSNITKFVEDFLDQNKDKVVRTLPYW